MKTTLFYKSCAKDFDWLKYSRDSVRKFCRGFDEIVLCLPEGESFDWPEANVVHVRETFTPYMFQQAIKLFADTWCSGDFITYQDSDTVFDRPVSPEDLIWNGKPTWILRPYDSAREDQQIWKSPTEKFMGEPVAFEGMYRHPFTVPRGVLQKMRGFCAFKHGVSLDEYIRVQCHPTNGLALTFSEWNALAAFAFKHSHDDFHWIDASKESVPVACCWQGYSHGGEARKQEDIAKFREILEDTPAASIAVQGVGKAEEVCVPPPLTLKGAIDFLVEEASKGQYQKIQVLKMIEKAGLKKGGHLKKVTPKPASERKGLDDKLLLAIHTYPGANENLARNWPHFKTFGADRIVTIGTTDGGCTAPEGEIVQIGRNAYIEGDHLVQRLIETVAWCLNQPEDRFAILEHDTLILRRPPRSKGICAHRTGGQLPRAKAKSFHHNPWCFDRASGEKLLQAMREVAPECTQLPDASPDVFFGYACQKAGLLVEQPWEQFTRNSLDQPGDLQRAVDAALNNCHVIHGVKLAQEYHAIMAALNGQNAQVSEKAA